MTGWLPSLTDVAYSHAICRSANHPVGAGQGPATIGPSNSVTRTSSLHFTPYDPTDQNSGANYWPGPWQHQYKGETKNYANDMPGTSSNPTSFTEVEYLTTINTTGAEPPGFTGITAHTARSGNIERWCVVKGSVTSFYLYTVGIGESCPTGTPN
jgi:hypothetical protein